jgi:hypothetical protein
MTQREAILRTFTGISPHRIVWQPRIYYWFYANGLRNKLPAGYSDRALLDDVYKNVQLYDGSVPETFRNKSIIELYEELDASPRYPQEVLGIEIFQLKTDPAKVRTVVESRAGQVTTIYETPRGTLREVTHHGYHSEFPVKSLREMITMAYVLDNTQFTFDHEAFKIADREFGDRGIVQSFYPRSPLQRLIISYMGFENTVYALSDNPREVHQFLEVIEEWDDKMYEVILNSPLQILNFGENIDANMDSPRLFKEYLLPYYTKRVEQIHRRGKFCHIHMDGALKPLLPFLTEAGFDGIEAATPLPQGDVTLEELKDSLGDRILLDGIPAVLFLPEYSKEELAEFACKVLEIFSPNLILGISDELPPGGDITKVALVSQIVSDYGASRSSSGY